MDVQPNDALSKRAKKQRKRNWFARTFFSDEPVPYMDIPSIDYQSVLPITDSRGRVLDVDPAEYEQERDKLLKIIAEKYPPVPSERGPASPRRGPIPARRV